MIAYGYQFFRNGWNHKNILILAEDEESARKALIDYWMLNDSEKETIQMVERYEIKALLHSPGDQLNWREIRDY